MITVTVQEHTRTITTRDIIIPDLSDDDYLYFKNLMENVATSPSAHPRAAEICEAIVHQMENPAEVDDLNNNSGDNGIPVRAVRKHYRRRVRKYPAHVVAYMEAHRVGLAGVPVIRTCVATGEALKFDSIAAAMTDLGADPDHYSGVLAQIHGESKTSYHHTWAWWDDRIIELLPEPVAKALASE